MGISGKTAFEEVYEEYYDRIYKAVYMRLLSKDNTEDVVQDTFIKAMKAYDRYDSGQSSVYTWLYTIATNTLYDYLRKIKSNNIISLEDYMESAGEPGENDKELEKLTDDYAREAYAILSQLKDEERNLLSMRFGMEMSYKEMAEVLSSNEKAVGMKMTRLLDKCRELAADL